VLPQAAAKPLKLTKAATKRTTVKRELTPPRRMSMEQRTTAVAKRTGWQSL
jgi:hypothetical protein